MTLKCYATDGRLIAMRQNAVAGKWALIPVEVRTWTGTRLREVKCRATAYDAATETVTYTQVKGPAVYTYGRRDFA